MRITFIFVASVVATSLLACERENSNTMGTGGSADDGGAHFAGASGAAASGGNASGGSASGGGSADPLREDDSRFTLLFRDDFEAFDDSRWSIMTHSWPTNLALFGANSVAVEGGELSVTLLDAPEGTKDDTGAEKKFFGAEVRSKATLAAGRVKARAKFAKGSGVVSSLVTIYTPWPADDWNELDYEVLGKNSSEIQSNVMVFTGAPPTPPVTTSVTPTQDPVLHELSFDSSADFHEYTLEWTPKGIFFLIDDVVVRSSTKHIELLDLPQNVLLTIWASSSPGWAGAIDETTSGARAVYDWIEVSTYVP